MLWDTRFKGENRKTCDGLDGGAGLGENRMGNCTDTLTPPEILSDPQFSSWMEISNLDEISISSSYSILITVQSHETAPVICYLPGRRHKERRSFVKGFSRYIYSHHFTCFWHSTELALFILDGPCAPLEFNKLEERRPNRNRWFNFHKFVTER